MGQGRDLHPIQSNIVINSESSLISTALSAIVKDALIEAGVKNVSVRYAGGLGEEANVLESKDSLLEYIARRNPRFFTSPLNVYIQPPNGADIESDAFSQSVLDTEQNLVAAQESLVKSESFTADALKSLNEYNKCGASDGEPYTPDEISSMEMASHPTCGNRDMAGVETTTVFEYLDVACPVASCKSISQAAAIAEAINFKNGKGDPVEYQKHVRLANNC